LYGEENININDATVRKEFKFEKPDSLSVTIDFIDYMQNGLGSYINPLDADFFDDGLFGNLGFIQGSLPLIIRLNVLHFLPLVEYFHITNFDNFFVKLSTWINIRKWSD